MILFHIVPARASLGEAQDHHGDGPGHAGEGDDDGAPGMNNRFIYTPHKNISLVSCITNRKFVGNVAQTRIRLSHESKAVLDLLMRAQLG